MNIIELNLGRSISAEREALGERDYSDNLIVLGYEYGYVCKDHIYSQASDDPDVHKARAANSITELQDVVTQALIMFRKLRKGTELENMTVEQFILDGLHRQQYRMKEVKEKKINYGLNKTS